VGPLQQVVIADEPVERDNTRTIRRSVIGSVLLSHVVLSILSQDGISVVEDRKEPELNLLEYWFDEIHSVQQYTIKMKQQAEAPFRKPHLMYVDHPAVKGKRRRL